MSEKVRCAIDIGSSGIVCVIGKYNPTIGELEIKGGSKFNCSAIHCGIIRDMNKAASALKEVVETTQEQANTDITRLTVAVRGRDVKSEILEGSLTIENSPNIIKAEDIIEVIERRAQDIDSKTVLHYLPIDYAIDGQWGRKNPLHMYGSRLNVKLAIFTRNASEINNIETLIFKAGYELEHEHVIYGLAALGENNDLVYENEKEMNCILIDFGGWSSGFIVFINGLMVACGEIYDVGSNYITRDIAQRLRLHFDSAEEIKKEYCYAMPSLIQKDEKIQLKSKKKETTLSEISSIAASRLEEMFTKRLQEKIGDYLPYVRSIGIILTGGGSKLKGCAQAFERFFDVPCRTAVLHKVKGNEEIINDPSYFTAISALKYETYMRQIKPISFGEKIKRIFKSIFG